MGLDAGVWRNKESIEREFGVGAFMFEPDGSPVATTPEFDRIDSDLLDAAHEYIGNIGLVGHLRDAVGQLLPQTSAIQRFVLYSGSHCGDHLNAEQIEAVARELAAIENSPDLHVQHFVGQMRRLIAVARTENNPI